MTARLKVAMSGVMLVAWLEKLVVERRAGSMAEAMAMKMGAMQADG